MRTVPLIECTNNLKKEDYKWLNIIFESETIKGKESKT